LAGENRYGVDFFQRTKADWPTLRGSFDALISTYPDAWNLNGYALFACIANDVERARMLLGRAANKEYLAGWNEELIKRCGE
jgi:hypothetical protein